MYKPLSDSTLMGMTKKEIIELLRIAERNAEAMRETLNQQAENCQKLLAEARKHGHWIYDDPFGALPKCSECGCRSRDAAAKECAIPYCPSCGAKMDEEAHYGK